MAIMAVVDNESQSKYSRPDSDRNPINPTSSSIGDTMRMMVEAYTIIIKKNTNITEAEGRL